MLCCPFHEDKTPSLQIYPKTNTYCCFSSNCTAGSGDVIDFIMKMEYSSKHEALLKAKELIGAPSTKLNAHIPEPVQLSRVAVLTKFYQSARNSFAKTKAAQQYTQARGLDVEKRSAAQLKAGYVRDAIPDSWTQHYISSAEQVGLLIKTSSRSGNSGKYRQRFACCLLFPLLNAKQQVTGLYGRGIEKGHYYLPGQHQGLYPSYPKEDTQCLILTESVIDAATLLQVPEISDNYSILACYGTNGFTQEHQQVVKSLSQLQEVILFFDGDESGRQGSQKLAEQLQQLRSNITISTVDTPEGEDINSLAQGHESSIFTHLLQNRHLLFSTENKNTIQTHQTQLNADNPNKLIYTTQTATYYIKGGIRTELDTLRVSLDIEHLESHRKYRSKPDLYEDKQITKVASEAADKLNLRADLLILDIEKLTDLLEAYREEQLQEAQQEAVKITVSSAIAQQCINFLSAPNLLPRLNDLIGKAGVVGEATNRLFLLVIATSYKMPDTLHALIQGSSGSGKTHLLIKVSSLIPEEDVKRFTRVTDSSFYNYGQYDLQNKLICLEDFDGMREEAQLAFRELQSRQMLSSSTSGKDEQGNIRSYERIVYGPIASLSCTTQGEVYEDNMSRCFLIAVDETSEQTHRIIAYQNQRAAGKIQQAEEAQTTEFIQHCIRMLKPYPVVNPYADQISLPPEAHKIRRLNELYQSFVRQVTLLNQYQRKQDLQGRLITEKEDLQVAVDIMFESILLKVDELDGSLRHFYEQLKSYVQGQAGNHASSYTFTQREIRQALKISKSGLHRFLQNLLQLEYIRPVGGYANKGYQYQITYWDNIAALRSRVKRYLQGQLDQLELIAN